MRKQDVRRRLAEINGLMEPSTEPQVTLAEAFTRQHYIAIAKIIKTAGTNSEGEKIARALAKMFADDNSQFDEDRFLQACGV